MKSILSVFCALLIFNHLSAQQKLDPGSMNDLIATKPNNIIYNDTVFKGSAQFQQLFFREGNQTLISYYQKHMSNKISGQVLGLIGSVAMIVGIGMVTDNGSNKGTGWAVLGGGFATSLIGGYLSLMGQRNLQMAVALFNQQHQKNHLGLGVGKNGAGLVYQF